MFSKVTAVACTVLILSACSPSSQAPLSDAERVAINEAIVDRMNDYVDALETLNPVVVESFYVDSPDFRAISDAQLLTRESLLALVGTLGEDLQSWEAVWDSITVTPLGRDVALADAWFRRQFTDNAGREFKDWGTVTWVWIKENSEWRLIHGQAVHYADSVSPFEGQDTPDD